MPATGIAIGLSGFAQTGKTTAANYIEQRYGVKRKHIAEPLRDMLRVLLRRYEIAEHMIDRYLEGDLKETVIPEIGKSGRELQISLGTEWGRQRVNDDLWAEAWAIGWRLRDRVMNDSVRFPNEENVIVGGMSGFTIMIRRKGTHPVAYKWRGLGRLLYRLTGCMWGVHDSERTDRLRPTYTINNDGDLTRLYNAIDAIMEVEGVRPIGYA